MRLRFGQAPDAEGRLLRARLAEFHSRASPLLAAAVRDRERRRSLEQALCREIASVHPGLVVEVHSRPSGLNVVVSPAEDDGLSVLCEEVIAGSKMISGVSFCRHEPELSVQEATTDVVGRTTLDLSAARARIGFSRGHLLEAVVCCPSYSSATDERVLSAADLLVRRLVGDALFDEWFGAVDIAPLPRGGPLRVLEDRTSATEDALPLDQVLPAARAAVSAVKDGLSAEPYHLFCERAEWTLFEMDPPRQEEYARLDDLALFSTMLPEAMKSHLEGTRFASSRFSKHGERFVYLKTDTLHASPRERLELRADLEDALSYALVPGRIGAVVGVGVGVRYVYVVLALEALDRGLAVARKKLAALGVDRRSWLLFCDAEWAHEWVEIRDDAPPPPLHVNG